MTVPQVPQSGDSFDRALAEYGLPATGAETGVAGPAAASGGARAGAIIGGLLLLLLVLTFTIGIALAAFAGMGVAALIQRQRGRRYTRVAGWLGAVAGTAVVLLGFVGAMAAFIPRDFSDQVRQQMQADASRPRRETAADTILANMVPGGKAASDAQVKALTAAFTNSSSTVVALLGVAMVFGCVVWSLMIGSAAWGTGSLLQFGLTGRWPDAGKKSAGLLRSPAAPVVRDAFDAIR